MHFFCRGSAESARLKILLFNSYISTNGTNRLFNLLREGIFAILKVVRS